MPMIDIVEDDANILEIESFALKNSGYAVRCFERAEPFFAALAERQPDLLLLDIMLPGTDGLTVLSRLRGRKETAKLPIILVTAKTAEIDTVKGLDAGADDYITKPFGVMELISRVKAVLRRSAQAPDAEELRLGEITLEPKKRLCTVGTVPVELTFKEYELLQLLMVNAGIVLRRDLIMERIWGMDFEGESRTLDVHVKTLRQKLGEEGRHIITVRNVGYTCR